MTTRDLPVNLKHGVTVSVRKIGSPREKRKKGLRGGLKATTQPPPSEQTSSEKRKKNSKKNSKMKKGDKNTSLSGSASDHVRRRWLFGAGHHRNENQAPKKEDSQSKVWSPDPTSKNDTDHGEPHEKFIRVPTNLLWSRGTIAPTFPQ